MTATYARACAQGEALPHQRSDQRAVAIRQRRSASAGDRQVCGQADTSGAPGPQCGCCSRIVRPSPLPMHAHRKAIPAQFPGASPHPRPLLFGRSLGVPG